MFGSIPQHGPLLLAANHPNDLADVSVILGSVSRKVSFVATVSATEQPFVGWAFQRMGVIPVHRIRDVRKAMARGEDSAEANRQAFSKVKQVLSEGGCVCVFPEGGVHNEHRIGKLRTGLARMALESAETIPDLTILPLGLVWEDPYSLRSSVDLTTGTPIKVDQAVGESGLAPDVALTERISDGLMEITRNAEDEDAFLGLRATQQLRDEYDRFKGEKLCRPRQSGKGTRSAQDLYNLLSSRFEQENPERLLRAWSESRDSPIPALLSSPLAIASLLIHLPIWWTVKRLASTLAKKEADIMPRVLMPGIPLVLMMYLLFAFLASVFAIRSGLNLYFTVGFAVFAVVFLLPALGHLALWWLDRVKDMWLVFRLKRIIPDLESRIRDAILETD